MRLWKQTPNESPGKIHEMALMQLAAKQKIAKDWPVFKDRFTAELIDEQYIRCKFCDLAIWQDFYMDQKMIRHVYQYTDDEKLALTVAHISNHHPEVYSGIE